ncbi:hypothetical protein F4826_004896 [Rahnella inusitata]|nr:hypothetical protein [Rahnella inusitata]
MVGKIGVSLQGQGSALTLGMNLWLLLVDVLAVLKSYD